MQGPQKTEINQYLCIQTPYTNPDNTPSSPLTMYVHIHNLNSMKLLLPTEKYHPNHAWTRLAAWTNLWPKYHCCSAISNPIAPWSILAATPSLRHHRMYSKPLKNYWDNDMYQKIYLFANFANFLLISSLPIAVQLLLAKTSIPPNASHPPKKSSGFKDKKTWPKLIKALSRGPDQKESTIILRFKEGKTDAITA